MIMRYQRIEPSPSLSHLVVCYWVVDSEGDDEVHRQKIIPDGYPELIFHYGDPYRINISGEWEVQAKHLVAGQISNHFFLENTGTSGMIGIKLQPAAIHELFGLVMSPLTDRVVPFEDVFPDQLQAINHIVSVLPDHEQAISRIGQWLLDQTLSAKSEPVRRALDLIFAKKGIVEVSELVNHSGVVERHLQRLFKRQVGLSPKFYSRIIRFSSIFQLIEEKDFSWAHVALKSGFSDQSHFIKNFQEFTGEDPAKYLFEMENLGNFFLKK